MPLAILLPALGVLLSLVFGGRMAERIALILMPVQLAIAIAIAWLVQRSGQPLVYALAGYAPPLGIALRADGFSVAMLVTTALIAPAAALCPGQFRTSQEIETRAPLVFWTLLQGLQAALSLIFVSGDLFNLYVGSSFSPSPRFRWFASTDVPKRWPRRCAICSSPCSARCSICSASPCSTAPMARSTSRSSLRAFAPSGRLVGGRADDRRAAGEDRAVSAASLAAPAHANAPAAASAVLSGLVVKGSFFLVVRLWFDVLAPLPGVLPGHDPRRARLGRILFGSVLALSQARLKLLIAYSTVAQIGYLFLMFPLSHGPGRRRVQRRRDAGALACLRKGRDVPLRRPHRRVLGHDGSRTLGAPGGDAGDFLALGVGGLSLMGLPPSGGFAAKWLLMKASIASGQWAWAIVMAGGGLLAGGYLYRVLAPALSGESAVLKKAPHAAVRASLWLWRLSLAARLRAA